MVCDVKYVEMFLSNRGDSRFTKCAKLLAMSQFKTCVCRPFKVLVGREFQMALFIYLGAKKADRVNRCFER